MRIELVDRVNDEDHRPAFGGGGQMLLEGLRELARVVGDFLCNTRGPGQLVAEAAEHLVDVRGAGAGADKM